MASPRRIKSSSRSAGALASGRGSGPARRRVLGLLPAALAMGLLPSFACAQGAYPQRAVRIVVPAPPGSSPDVIARLWAERATKLTGQPVVVENKTGATTIVAAQAVAAAPPDGYTLLWTFNNTFSINPFIFRKLPYSANDFVPVSQVLAVPFVLLTSAQSPWQTLPQLLQEARAKPDSLTYGSAGVGSAFHVLMVKLLNAGGATMVHVPYKDAFIPDLMARRIDVSFDASTGAIAQVRGGRLRALSVTSPKRLEQLPDVPTIAETFPGFVADSWQGLFAPAGTPGDVVSAVAALSNQIVEAPDFQAKLREYGLVPVGSSPAAFKQFLADDARGWERVVRDNRISLD